MLSLGGGDSGQGGYYIIGVDDRLGEFYFVRGG